MLREKVRNLAKKRQITGLKSQHLLLTVKKISRASPYDFAEHVSHRDITRNSVPEDSHAQSQGVAKTIIILSILVKPTEMGVASRLTAIIRFEVPKGMVQQKELSQISATFQGQ